MKSNEELILIDMHAIKEMGLRSRGGGGGGGERIRHKYAFM